MSGMAEVLAGHQDAEAPNGGRFCICGEWEGSWTGTSFAERQAAMLTAAGFGPVKEAKATALEEAAEAIRMERPEVGRHINVSEYRIGKHDAFTLAAVICSDRSRAAAVRGES